MNWRRALLALLALPLMAQAEPPPRQQAERRLEAGNATEAHTLYRRALAGCEAGVEREPLDSCVFERLGTGFTGRVPGVLEADERQLRRDLAIAKPRQEGPLRLALYRNLAEQEKFKLLLVELKTYLGQTDSEATLPRSGWHELLLLRARTEIRLGNPSAALDVLRDRRMESASPLVVGMIAEALGDAQAALAQFRQAADSYRAALAAYAPLETGVIHSLSARPKLIDALLEFDTEGARLELMELAVYLQTSTAPYTTGYPFMVFLLHEFPAWVVAYDAAIQYAQEGDQLDFPFDCGPGLIDNGSLRLRAAGPATFARHNLVKGTSYWVRRRYEEAEFCFAWANNLAARAQPVRRAIQARALMGVAAAELHRIAAGTGTGSRARFAQLLRAARHHAEESLPDFNTYRIVLNGFSAQAALWTDGVEAYFFADSALQGALRGTQLLPTLADPSWLASDVALANPITSVTAAWAAAHRPQLPR